MKDIFDRMVTEVDEALRRHVNRVGAAACERTFVPVETRARVSVRTPSMEIREVTQELLKHGYLEERKVQRSSSSAP